MRMVVCHGWHGRPAGRRQAGRADSLVLIPSPDLTGVPLHAVPVPKDDGGDDGDDDDDGDDGDDALGYGLGEGREPLLARFPVRVHVVLVSLILACM